MDPIKISPELLAKAGASSIRLAPGDVVFKDGDAPDKMYVVLSGEVEIHLRDTIIETVSQGGTFGEMALIDGSPRSATVIAKTDSQVAAIDKKTFMDELEIKMLFGDLFPQFPHSEVSLSNIDVMEENDTASAHFGQP